MTRLQKDLNFLSGFNKLEELRFYAANNFSVFQYLPTLLSLQYLDVTSCRGLEQIAFPDLSPAKLKALSFDSNKISDQTADEILTKLVASNSADSLEFLNLNGNYLTKIPSQVGSVFPQLKTAHIGANNISYIPSSSVTIAYPLESLYLGTNGLKTIESGAFQGKATSARAIILFFGLKKTRIIIRILLVSIIGNFTMTYVTLSSNQFTVFEEGVFKEMLQQMVSVKPPIGLVQIGGSIFLRIRHIWKFLIGIL